MANMGIRWGTAIAFCLITAHAAADEPTTPPPQQQPQPPQSSNATRADALFQEGKTLFEARRFAEACARFAESDALDPTVSALGLLAGCHEQMGKLATAWREYRETEKRASATGDGRAAFARERAAALEPRLPRLTVSLARPVVGIEILRNADRVPPEDLGVDVPVDPGPWEIVARAPDRREFHATVAMKEGAREAVLVPELQPIPAVQAPPLPDPSKSIAPPETTNPRLTAALIVGGIGLTGVGVGVALGASASNQNTTSNRLYALCSRTGQGCAEGRQIRDGALSTAAGATVGFGVGIAGLAASAVLLLLPRSKQAPMRREAAGVHVTPVVGPAGGGASFAGRF